MELDGSGFQRAARWAARRLLGPWSPPEGTQILPFWKSSTAHCRWFATRKCFELPWWWCRTRGRLQKCAL